MSRAPIAVAVYSLPEPAKAVCTENFIRVDAAPESPKLAE
jgi:hypothetical protein